jgi:hypothetical protein
VLPHTGHDPRWAPCSPSGCARPGFGAHARGRGYPLLVPRRGELSWRGLCACLMGGAPHTPNSPLPCRAASRRSWPYLAQPDGNWERTRTLFNNVPTTAYPITAKASGQAGTIGGPSPVPFQARWGQRAERLRTGTDVELRAVQADEKVLRWGAGTIHPQEWIRAMEVSKGRPSFCSLATRSLRSTKYTGHMGGWGHLHPYHTPGAFSHPQSLFPNSGGNLS